MYGLVGTVMLFRGFVDAIMMRTQQVMAAGPLSHGYLGAEHGYLPPYHYDQIYGSHGTIMLIFAATPILAGFMNYLVPLQIGARDMAFPYLNALAFWMTAVGAGLVMISLFIGDFSHAGWVGLAPLTELPYSPDVGVDYWTWALQIGSIGTTIGAVNIIATIVKMRAPGMTWMRLSLFTWTSLTTNVIGLTAFPVLGVAIGLLSLDRYFGHAFLYHRRRRQLHAVHRPVLDLGSSGGVLHHPAVLGDDVRDHPDLLAEEAVRLSGDGRRDAEHRLHLLDGLAAPFLHHGCRADREHLLQHCNHAGCDPDRRKGIRLGADHGSRPPHLSHPDAVGGLRHLHADHRRLDRHDAGRSPRSTT